MTLLDDNSLHMWTLRGHKGLSELLEIGRFMLTGPPGYTDNVDMLLLTAGHSLSLSTNALSHAGFLTGGFHLAAAVNSVAPFKSDGPDVSTIL